MVAKVTVTVTQSAHLPSVRRHPTLRKQSVFLNRRFVTSNELFDKIHELRVVCSPTAPDGLYLDCILVDGFVREGCRAFSQCMDDPLLCDPEYFEKAYDLAK
jgi:hypothetical protein